MHLHIISSGENIHNTFPTSIKYLDGITNVGVVVEDDIFRDNPGDNAYKKETKPKIRNAIDQLKKTCETMSIGYNEIRIPDTSLISVRDAILLTSQDLPDARFSFNLSGGTKMLSLSLFVMALWLDAEIYLAPNTKRLESVAIPRMHLSDVRKNPNFVEALQILGRKNGQETSDPNIGSWTPGKDLSRVLTERYQPIRFSGDNSTKNKPNRGTISKILAPLEEWGLIEERIRPQNKREKDYRLTKDGSFALVILKAEKSRKPE